MMQKACYTKQSLEAAFLRQNTKSRAVYAAALALHWVDVTTVGVAATLPLTRVSVAICLRSASTPPGAAESGRAAAAICDNNAQADTKSAARRADCSCLQISFLQGIKHLNQHEESQQCKQG